MALQHNKDYVTKIYTGINGKVNIWRCIVALHKRQTKQEKVGTRTIDVNKRGFSVMSTALCSLAAQIERREVSLIGNNAISATDLDNAFAHLRARYGGQLRSMVERGELTLLSDVHMHPLTKKRLDIEVAQYRATIDAADMVESED